MMKKEQLAEKMIEQVATQLENAPGHRDEFGCNIRQTQFRLLYTTPGTDYYGNGARSYMKVFVDTKDLLVARCSASRLLATENMQAALQQMQHERNVVASETATKYRAELVQMCADSKEEGKPTQTTAKFMEMRGKAGGFFGQKTPIVQVNTIIQSGATHEDNIIDIED